MKHLFTLGVTLTLSSAFLATAAGTPSSASQIQTPLASTETRFLPSPLQGNLPAILRAELPQPDPNSPQMPTVISELPQPDPNSPQMPTVISELPQPDPNSPQMPTVISELPQPDPNSPQMPTVISELPQPDPNSPQMPTVS